MSSAHMMLCSENEQNQPTRSKVPHFGSWNGANQLKLPSSQLKGEREDLILNL